MARLWRLGHGLIRWHTLDAIYVSAESMLCPPSVYDLLSFLLHLSSILRSPGAVLNYFSSIKIWVCTMPGEHQSFLAHKIAVMKKGILKSAVHVPSPAPGISPSEFLAVIDYLHHASPVPWVIVLALLLAYLMMLRQSNFVQTTSSPGPHVLMFDDVECSSKALLGQARSTKTSTHSSPPILF